MEIASLKLRNFRNHRGLYEEFDSGLNVIIGANGLGKSNIIEAIALLATTKSFRTSDYRNIIEHNREFAAAEGDCDNKKLRIVISKMGRRFQCDQNPIKTSSDFIGLFQAVVFTPEDLSFITSSPRIRRRLIDSELSKVNKKYLRNLSEFNTILKNRNAKFDKQNRNQLHPFYMIYVCDGSVIHIDHLNPKKLLDIFRHLCMGKTMPDRELCEQFNNETKDGKDMSRHSELLYCAVKSIVDINEESAVDSLFSIGGTTSMTDNINGLDDFELVCFLAVK